MKKSSFEPTRISDRFAYLANSLAASISVLIGKPVVGVWPEVGTVTTAISRDGQKLTLANIWSFTVTPTDQLIAANLAATVYDEYIDGWEVTREQKDSLASNTYNQPLHVWRQLTGIANRETGTNWVNKVAGAASVLGASWANQQFRTDFPQMAAYANLQIALVASSPGVPVDLFRLFIQCCGADDWLKREIFNHLYDQVLDQIEAKQHALGNGQFDRAEAAAVLDDIDITASAFVALETPWDETSEDGKMAMQLTLMFSKYVDTIDKLLPGGAQSTPQEGQGSPGQPRGGNTDDMEPDMLPDLVSAVMDYEDVADAVERLLPSKQEATDDEGANGVAAGTSSNIIRITNTRVPTSEEAIAASDLADVLTKFSAAYKPGEVSGQEDGRVDCLAWFVAKHRSPGALNWRKRDVPDRRQNFSTALAVVGDTSGSMSGDNIKSLSSSMWTITEGFRRANQQGSKAAIWTACFNTVWEQVTCTSSHVSEFAADGGTNPGSALLQATKWLSEQQVAHRFLVVWTDDAWGDVSADPEHTTLESCIASNVPITRVMFVPPSIRAARSNHFITVTVNKPADMVEMFRDRIDTALMAAANNF